MQLSTGSHCVFNLKAHLIFVVAYRRKVISSTILERLKEI
ncbi:transposase, partial [uncultured Parasutterella sp.]